MNTSYKECLSNKLFKSATKILLSLDSPISRWIWPWHKGSEAASKISRSDRGRSLLQKLT